MTHQRVLILHGYQHTRARDHWLWWLAEELRTAGVPVQYPQFPTPHQPELDAWLDLAHAELAMLGDGQRIVVAHSLGTVLWSHLRAQGVSADRVLLVSPPDRARLANDVPGFDIELDTSDAELVGRETDPYRHESLAEIDRGRARAVHELPGDGHITIDDGFGPFPAALTWVRTGSFAG